MLASEHAILVTHSSLDILISLLRKAAYHDAGGAAVQAEVSEKRRSIEPTASWTVDVSSTIFPVWVRILITLT